MKNQLVTIVYNANPAFMPHMLQQAKTLSKAGHRVWGIGISNKEQRSTPAHSFFRIDCIQPLPLIPRGPLYFIYFKFRVFIILFKFRPMILQPIDVPSLFPCWLHSVLRQIPMHYLSLEDAAASHLYRERPFRKEFWLFIERFCIKRAVKVAVVGRMDAESFMSRYPIPMPHIIRNVPELLPLLPSDQLQLRHTLGWTGDHIVMFYHGLIEEGRGIELSFTALKEIPRLRMAIAGYGNFLPTLRTMAKNLGVDNQIGWIGPYAHADLGTWLQDADFSLFLPQNISPSLYQAFPCKLFESVHAVVPIITANFPEMHEYITSTGVGTTVETSKQDLVTKELCRMADDAELRERCRAACRKEREKTNWEEESKEYLKFLGLS